MEGDRKRAIAYERPNRLRGGMFAGRFVTLAAVGLVIGAVFLLFDGAILLAALQIAWRKGGAPFEVVTSMLRVALDGLLVAGCVSAILRRPLARRLLTLFAKGQFVDAVVMGLAVAGLWLIWRDTFRLNPIYYWAIGLFFGVRGVIAWVVLVSWQGMHADFYFGTASATVPAEGGATGVRPMQLERRTARFLIRGSDIADGRDVEYRSNAQTEELARKAGVALGVEPKSITIIPVPAEESEAAMAKQPTGTM